MKRFFKDKENRLGIVGCIIIVAILVLVSSGVTFLVENGNEAGVSLTLVILIFWIVWLYISKGEVKEKYKRLLHFAHGYYKEVKKMKVDEYGYIEDHALTDFESEFEEWLSDQYFKELERQIKEEI